MWCMPTTDAAHSRIHRPASHPLLLPRRTFSLFLPHVNVHLLVECCTRMGVLLRRLLASKGVRLRIRLFSLEHCLPRHLLPPIAGRRRSGGGAPPLLLLRGMPHLSPRPPRCQSGCMIRQVQRRLPPLLFRCPEREEKWPSAPTITTRRHPPMETCEETPIAAIRRTPAPLPTTSLLLLLPSRPLYGTF